MDYYNNGKRLKPNNFNTKPSIFGFYNDNNHNDKHYRSNYESNQDQTVNGYKERDFSLRKKHNNLKNVQRLMGYKKINNLEYPPFSRLFILYPKEASESELSNSFQKFGVIQDISIIRDPVTQIEKGLFKNKKK